MVMQGYPNPWYFDQGTEASHICAMRTLFASTATDLDIESCRHLVPHGDKVVEGGPGQLRIKRNAEPDNWRQQARFIHANLMIAESMKVQKIP